MMAASDVIYPNFYNVFLISIVLLTVYIIVQECDCYSEISEIFIEKF